MLDFNQFKLLTFDCYGTLIDWERGIIEATRSCIVEHGIGIGEDQVLETYAEIESSLEAGPYHPYRKILHQVMIKMCERFGFTPGGTEFTALADSVQNWPPFDDTVQALRTLKSRFQLGIISNVDDDLFEGSRKQLQVEFDYIITAAQVGAYKPSLKVFEFALDKINFAPTEILHVAQSLYHDHLPAKEIGLKTVWINRRVGKPGTGATPPAEAIPDAEFPGLASFAKAAVG